MALNVRELLSFFGLAIAEDLRVAREKISELSDSLGCLKQYVLEQKQQLQQVRLTLSTRENEYTALKEAVQKRQERHDWCSPNLVEFPVEAPIYLQKRTVAYLQRLLSPRASFFDLINPDKFSSAEQWGLYWCLARASSAAGIATTAKVEDGISRAFLDALTAEAKIASSFLKDGNLQIAYNAIFEQSEPAMKEAAVGADILLIIAGSSLVPNGLARIFWIQAKKAVTGAYPFTLRYGQKNAQGLQVEALSKVDVPERGSFGLYMQYSDSLSYIPAVRVSDLSWNDGKFVGNLSTCGVRLPELLVGCTCNFPDVVGAFENTDELCAYLDEVSDMKPLYIVTVTSGDRECRREPVRGHLLSYISDYYREKLGLTRTHKRDRNNGVNMGR